MSETGKRRPRPLLAAICVIGAALLSVLLWKHSPGPEWLAGRTARQYVLRYAPEYGETEVLEGVRERTLLPALFGERLGVAYPTWVVVCRHSPDDPEVLRLELSDGLFPLSVTDAGFLDLGARTPGAQ